MVSSEQPPSRAGSLTLVGGEIALDFANTSSGRGDPTHQEHLRASEHVVQWAEHARILAPEDAGWLLTKIAADKKLGADLFDAALALREDVYSICVELSAGRGPPRDQVESLARAHALSLTKAHLASFGENFGWAWSPRETPVEAITGPISLSALTLLQQADLTRVKQCQGDKCGWLFFDATKNKSRRWCEMEICGNRAKQKRFAARSKTH